MGAERGSASPLGAPREEEASPLGVPRSTHTPRRIDEIVHDAIEVGDELQLQIKVHRTMEAEDADDMHASAWSHTPPEP